MKKRVLIPCTLFLVSFSFAATTVEWVLLDNTTLSTTGGALGATGVTAEIRATPIASGTLYDVRLRNRTTTKYDFKALRIRIPRTGNSTTAIVEGQSTAIPLELFQFWTDSGILGPKHGFRYEIRSQGSLVRANGPSTQLGTWGSRASGIVRLDGQAYAIPEFWERQPRRIAVTSTEVILSLYEPTSGSEPLRAGEDIWDRFAMFTSVSLTDADIVTRMERLPLLTDAERTAIRARFAIASEGLQGGDADSETWLRKYDRWQGTSWDKAYADPNPQRNWGGETDSQRTTLFSMFERGANQALPGYGVYSWRDWGDMLWDTYPSYPSHHYDWVRHAFRHYLRTGNQEALRWAMSAVRHSVSVDFLWIDRLPYERAGLARYEWQDHGDPTLAKTSHTWGEGLFMAAAMTNDPWIQEASTVRADMAYKAVGGSNAFRSSLNGEIRMYTWPMLILLRAYTETGDAKYWTKCKQIVDELIRHEQLSDGRGYFRYLDGNRRVSGPLMVCYAARPLVEFAVIAESKGEWTSAHLAFYDRMLTWLTTPVPDGPYYPPTTTDDPADIAYYWCPPGETCTQPTSGPQRPYNLMLSAWTAFMAQKDPKWIALARKSFSSTVLYALHGRGIVGYLTDAYPNSESKLVGWIQLFPDRAAMWIAGSPNVPFPPPGQPPVGTPPPGGGTPLPGTGVPVPPDLSGINGRSFRVNDEVGFTYAGSVTGFEWEIQSISGDVGSRALGVLPTPNSPRTTVLGAPYPTQNSSLGLSTFNLTPGNYTLRVRAMNESLSSAWASANISLVLADLNAVRVYPNPWRSDRHTGDITFDNLSLGATVKIFNTAGHLVRELTPSGAGAGWDRKNKSGDTVASGIYLYVITDNKGNQVRGKIGVVR